MHMQKIILTLLLLISTSVFADNFSDSNKIMNWAEETYPEYFPKELLNDAWNTVGYKGDKYIARHYKSDTINTYIGTTNGIVYTYNAAKWGSGLGEMGTMESVLARVSPERFTMDWLNGKTLYITYFEATENISKVIKFSFDNGSLIYTGLFNDTTNETDTYSVNAAGRFNVASDDPADGDFIVCGGTDKYIKTHYYERGLYSESVLYFFNESDALEFAATLTQPVAKCEQ